jgi:gluconokinase
MATSHFSGNSPDPQLASPKGPVSTETEAAEAAAARAVRGTVLVLMGVSGSGKSSIALELQRLLGWKFQEGDDLHPPANVEKMRSGRPLTDEDRWPWLARVARWIDDRLGAGEPGIITCSNLRRAYRRVTIGDRSGVMLVYLRGDEKQITARLAQRHHLYMPASLLHSQFEALEEPSAEERPIVVSIEATITEATIDVLHKVAAVQRGEHDRHGHSQRGEPPGPA